MSPVSRILAVGGLVLAVAAVGTAGVLVAGGLSASASPAPAGAAPTVEAGVSEEPEPTPQSFPPGETPPPLPPTPSLEPSTSPEPSPSPTPPGVDPLLGQDGRLTLLLLGSDYRPAHPGNRTDAIMVVSVEPVSGATAAFSIPRDTLNFPLPGGGVFGSKVNALYQYLAARTGNGGRAMREAISKALKVEIDGYVLIGFAGLRRLVDAVGGVTVVLDKAYYDPYYWVNNRTQGWGLPKGRNHLNGTQALIFARSRKGDSDFGRARRQQELVMATLDRVRRLGLSRLPRLLRIARDTVRTDLPLDKAITVYEIVSRADLAKAKRVIFKPKVYTHELGGSAVSLDLAVCRRWIARNFPPAQTGATWPPAPSTSPVPIPTPSPGATPWTRLQ